MYLLLSYFNRVKCALPSNSYCAAISCGYTYLFYHTEWLDSTTTSQPQGSSEGGWASIGSWGQPRPAEQGEDRMAQCIECMLTLSKGRWYVMHTMKPEAISVLNKVIPIFKTVFCAKCSDYDNSLWIHTTEGKVRCLPDRQQWPK